MNIKEYIASGIVEMYAMGLCSAEENREFEALLLQYPELGAALKEFELQLEEKMMQDAIMPPSATGTRILNDFNRMAVKQDAKLVQLKTPSPFKWKWVAAASVVLALAAGNIYQFINNSRPFVVTVSEKGQTLPARDYAIMQNPSITPVAMYGQGFHSICRCTLFWDKSSGKAYLMIHHLPESSDKKDYQLWTMVNGKPVSAGIVKDDIRGRFIELSNIPPGADAFLVTLEKAGGAAEPGTDLYLKGEI